MIGLKIYTRYGASGIASGIIVDLTGVSLCCMVVVNYIWS